MGNKFVTLIFLIYSIEGVTGNDCATTLPQGSQCQGLKVVNGKACYTKKSASVSCENNISLETSQFTCTNNKDKWSWTPTNAPTCVSTATPASTSLRTQFDTTESMYSTTFSILMPSENSLFETDFLSATLSMKTSVLPSHTVISDYSTIQQTGIQTISVTETVTSNSVSASTQPGPAVPKEIKESDITAVYITVPIVVCIIAVIVVIIFLFCRQRRMKSVQTLKREKGPSSSITNKTYENAIERHCSLINVRKSRDSGYAEIPLDFLHQDETSGSVYQTIDSLPEDQIKSSTTYGHLKQQTTQFMDMNYSHTNIIKTAEQSVTDTFYNHTEKAEVTNQSKHSIEDGGATYNRLNATSSSKTVIESAVKADDGTEPEYDHAKAGGTDQENKADNYSHLNGSSQTQQTFARHEKHQYHIKDNRTKLPDIQPYEFAKEPESPGYEFAKDVENHNNESTSMNVTDTSLKQEYRELKQECTGNQGYETAVGNSNTYFILEPEEGPGSNDVVGDFSDEKLDTTDNAESVNHQYFTLEKTDT
ncbi:uncharacterized protein LOC123551722 [Mercenaria mercenaria]|uniref:uncharacterized protein LOC123551722 n=1 Tax=Mercenaria mercenaria TaxID=6596 RepID=UPI00234EEE43|nr:uncharacterized protein LOC123551722 [Mercenaria mercenaria]